MLRTLIDRFDRIQRPAEPLAPEGKKTFLTKIFQRLTGHNDGPGLLDKIKSAIDRLRNGRTHAQLAQQNRMEKLRQSFATVESVSHIKIKPMTPCKPTQDTASPFMPRPLETFEPAVLNPNIDDLLDAITLGISDPDKRMKVTTHLMAAERIHTSVCQTYLFPSVDKNLNLDEASAPQAVHKTLNDICDWPLDAEVRKNILALCKSVAFYHRRLQQQGSDRFL